MEDSPKSGKSSKSKKENEEIEKKSFPNKSNKSIKPEIELNDPNKSSNISINNKSNSNKPDQNETIQNNKSISNKGEISQNKKSIGELNEKSRKNSKKSELNEESKQNISSQNKKSFSNDKISAEVNEKSRKNSKKSEFNEQNISKKSDLKIENDDEAKILTDLISSPVNPETFVTQQPPQTKLPYSLYDFLFPGGKLAKLCRIHDFQSKEINIPDILTKFKVTEPSPVVIFAGSKENTRGKFFAGIARACFRTDAVIIDSGISSGIELFSLRKNIKLIGVAPEKLIKFPKINPTVKDPFELTNGHSHLFLLNQKDNESMRWGDETKLKFSLANCIASGQYMQITGRPRCKIVVVLLGDNDECLSDLECAVEMKLPIIVCRDSELNEEIVNYLTKENYELKKPYLLRYLKGGHYYVLGSNNSEEIASFLHFFLTVTPYDTKKK